MISLNATVRDNKTKGQLSDIRNNGNVPAIIYGGEDQNEKISISKKILKSLIESENFLSSIITLNVEGKTQKVLPREIKYDGLCNHSHKICQLGLMGATSSLFRNRFGLGILCPRRVESFKQLPLALRATPHVALCTESVVSIPNVNDM